MTPRTQPAPMTGDAPRTTPRPEPFGTLPDGTVVDRWTLSSGGITLRVLSYGGIVQALEAPDRQGRPANIVLGFDSLGAYAASSTYFGALVGRCANRVAGGSFTLDGVTHRLDVNEGEHCLHGGRGGFGTRLWNVQPTGRDIGTGLRLRHVSPDGDMGFPGELDVTVDYVLTPSREFIIDYRATTDRPTIVNLTNHTYFNLAGEDSGSVDGHLLEIAAGRFTPVGEGLIPSGQIDAVAGTPLDFRRAKAIGRDIRAGHPQITRAQGFDHNFVLDKGATGDPQTAATLHDPGSGRTMALSTTEPGLQFYSGNFLDGSLPGSSGRVYRQGDGLCLESQHFPDAPNQPSFPSVVLRPGQMYRSTTVHAFSAQ